MGQKLGKIISIDSNIEKMTKEQYDNLIEYLFLNTDYFMLVYSYKKNCGIKKSSKDIKEKFKPFLIKKKREAESFSGYVETGYIYKNNPISKSVIKSFENLRDLCGSLPTDLTFYKGNICWFYSVTREDIAVFLHADDKDIEFLYDNHFISQKSGFDNYIDHKDYYESYNEIIEP